MLRPSAPGVAQLHVEIARDAEAMRALDAELHTRARLPQLQSWNDSALLMSAPAPAQMLAAPAQLVAYMPGGGGADATAPGQVTPARAPAVLAVARDAAILPKPLPTIEAARPDAAPIMAAQVALRSHAPAPAQAQAQASLASLSPGETVRSASPAARSDRHDAAGRARAGAASAKAADPIAEIAERAPRIDPTTDVADLTGAIGRELKADTSTRRVSLR